MKNLTDLEMLRIVCDRTKAIDIIDMTDYPLACEIRQRLDSTKPEPKPHVESSFIPETNQSLCDRLPDPKESPLRHGFKIGDRYKK